jgi:hypothetical protein
MKTIVLTATPTPNMNLAKITIESNDFDPHLGPNFSISFVNPSGLVIDRTYKRMSFDQWQDWSSESSEIADYKYIADCITTDIGVPYIEMIEPKPPVPPSIVTQPTGATIPLGNQLSLSVMVSGDYPMSYQWYKGATLLAGKTDSSLNILTVADSDAGSYTVKVSNSGGSVTSSAAVVVVGPAAPPTILYQPMAQTINVGTTLSLYVNAQGAPTLSYIWKKNSVTLPSFTGNTVSIANAQQSDEGIYSVVVSNSVGSVSSNQVPVIINL